MAEVEVGTATGIEDTMIVELTDRGVGRRRDLLVVRLRLSVGGEEVRVTLVAAGVGAGASRVRRLGDGERVLWGEVVVGGEEVRVTQAMGAGVAAGAGRETEGGEGVGGD